MSKVAPSQFRYPERWGSPGRRWLARIQLMLWRVWNAGRNLISPEESDPLPPPPDPLAKFPDPANADLFRELREGTRPVTRDADALWNLDGYQVRCHPDLCEFLYQLMPEDSVVKGSAYGFPVLVNRNGRVFAHAGGTHSVFLRLDPGNHIAARQDNGRFDPTHGKEWIEFRFGGLVGGPSDWKASMQRWAKVSLEDSLEGPNQPEKQKPPAFG